jgi:6-pyruvoyltetrahydropterin/6-carboxytetrahydropterin synthase
MIIAKKFTFDSAHFLPNYVGKCKQIHGHTYMLEVLVEGEINPDTGMVMDFQQVKYTVQKYVIDVLDHKLLNDVIENPTAENIIHWIKKAISLKIDNVIRLRLWESADSYVEL